MGNCLAAGLVLDDSIGECKPKSAFAEMHTAVLAGDKSLLLKALAAGADADPDRRFRTLTPLMWAAIRGHTSCLRVLLEYGASFDASTESGLTPTMLATIAGNADCLRLLIERGANINVVTRQGKTALDHAIERARVQCAAILITEARNTVRSHPLTAAQSKEGSISGGMQHVGSLQHHCLEGTRIAQLESLPIMEKLTALLVELAEPVLLGGEGAQDVFKDDRKCGGIHTSTSETSIQRWLVPQVELQMGKLIGSGAASRVYAGSWQGTEVAIKTFMLPQKNSHPRVLDSDSLRHRISNIQAEAELLASIRHPNILNFLALCSEPPCLITEKCEPGSLLDILHRAKDEPSVGSLLTWDKRLGIAGDAAAGMAYLHQRSTPCMHRNLKSSNILIMSSWDAKISGFGRSKTVHEATAKSAGVAAASLDSTLGDMNPRFLVPEVLKKGEWTLASDVYSFGIILWELMTWQMPWSHFSDDSMVRSSWSLSEELHFQQPIE